MRSKEISLYLLGTETYLSMMCFTQSGLVSFLFLDKHGTIVYFHPT